jgi:phospholipid/cholesterol/gamma-HCH transport system substrate-binding protein
MKGSQRNDHIRAGLFVLIGVMVFVLAVFLLGRKSALFTPTDTLFVRFAEVNGLTVGSPVRLSGLEVGSVEAITFPKNLRTKGAVVKLAVRSTLMERVREDSRAFIDSNGLLGDKIINISLGDPSLPRVRDGGTLKAGETLTFESLANTLHTAIESVKGVAQKAELVLGQTADSEVQADIRRITSSLANVLEEVESGKGSVHSLIYEPRHARELDDTLASMRVLALRTRAAMERVDHVLAEVESGQGGLHRLVYGKGAADAVEQFALAAREVSTVLREVREGQGLAHTLLYDDDAAEFITELNAFATTLNRMAGEVDQGRGTLGGLIKDPTVYEDLKTVLGNVRRNVLFKALIRATIENDGLRRPEQAPHVEVHAENNETSQ